MCGLIGVSGSANASQEVYYGLLNLQHRGQDGAGILSIDHSRPGGFHLHTSTGLVENVFSERTFKNIRGTAALGHTRYATVGKDDPNLLQPFLDFDLGIGLAHNGNIVNFYDLREDLHKSGDETHITLQSDSALILEILSAAMDGKPRTAENIFAAIKVCMNQLVGSYSVVCLTREGDIFGFRDPDGIRPLSFGSLTNDQAETSYAIASETVALDFLGYENMQEISPGEAVFITNQGQVTRRTILKNSQSPCMFEWVYFARVESSIGQKAVYQARFRLGKVLAKHIKKLKIEADIVVPVPETSRASAIAMSEVLDLPFREILVKNRYVNRTFILDGQESRKEAIRRKLFPIGAEFAGKRCLIVDDSIVRGNTARQIVKLVRQAGAREVILVSSCPPITHACFYGIDFPSANELIAYQRNEREVARSLGADRVVFQTIEGLKEALEQDSLCMGCLTGDYPTAATSAQRFEQNRLKDRSEMEQGYPVSEVSP